MSGSGSADVLLSTQTLFSCHILPYFFFSKPVRLISLKLPLIYDAVHEITMRSSGVTVALEN